jgi:plastocyanin
MTTPTRFRAAVAVTTTALLAAGASASFALQPASAAPHVAVVPADEPCTDTAPGVCDAYKPGDPFVDDGSAPKNIPKGTLVAASFKFFPAKVTAKKGATVTFDNRDIAIHNVQTAKKVKGKYQILSKDAAGGEKTKFKVPKKAGKFKVICFYHQSMVSTIIVK